MGESEEEEHGEAGACVWWHRHELRGCVVPGAGAYEVSSTNFHIIFLSISFKVACHTVLKKFLETVKGKARLGIQAYADGLMIIPKTLAANAGYDSQEVMVKLLEEARD